MACNLGLTVYNQMPEWLSDGNHTPFHSEHIDPFRHPFTFGPKHCTKSGYHVGMNAAEDVIGTFAGSEGDFLVLAPNRFILLTPKMAVTLEATFFPDHTTHEMILCEKAKSYPIMPGSVIMCLDQSQTTSLRCMTFFMGIVEAPAMCHARSMLMGSLARLQKIWTEVHDANSKSIQVNLFSKVDASDRSPVQYHHIFLTPPQFQPQFFQPQFQPRVNMFDALVSVVQSIENDGSAMSAKDVLQSGLPCSSRQQLAKKQKV